MDGDVVKILSFRVTSVWDNLFIFFTQVIPMNENGSSTRVIKNPKHNSPPLVQIFFLPVWNMNGLPISRPFVFPGSFNLYLMPHFTPRTFKGLE